MTCSGIYTALITPFNEAGELDVEGLRHLVQRQEEAEIHGLLALGSTGEAPTLSLTEKEIVISIVREEWESKPLMVGCGAYSTTQTIENVQHAAALGADCALIVTPFYNKPTQEGVFRHFEAISRVTPIPIIVYNHPGRTGVNIETSTLQRIAELYGIIGVKETSGNAPQVTEVIYQIKQQRPSFAVLSGDDNMALATLALGGDGVLSGVSNLFPEVMMELWNAYQEGALIQAQQLNLSLTPLYKALSVETHPIPLKAMMGLAGLPAGQPRLPLTPLQQKFIPILEECIQFQRKDAKTQRREEKEKPIVFVS